jgi:hypothetical protein
VYRARAAIIWVRKRRNRRKRRREEKKRRKEEENKRDMEAFSSLPCFSLD